LGATQNAFSNFTGKPMLTYLDKLPYSDRLVLPSDAKGLKSTNLLLEKMGLVYQVNSGFYMLSPIMQIVQQNIEDIAMYEARSSGFQPITLPFLISPSLVEKSGKMEEYSHEFYNTSKDGKDYLFAPTTEETVVQYLKDGGLQSYKQLPIKFVHPHHVFRHIKRPEGFFKSRDFRAFLLSSFDTSKEQYQISLKAFSGICDRVFEKTGIDTHKLNDDQEVIVEYLFDCDIGDRPIDKGVIANRLKDIKSTNEQLPPGWNTANIAMGYEFQNVSAFNLTFMSAKNSRETPVMGTFGIGIQRCSYALFQKARLGSNEAFNSNTRPFDIVIVPVGAKSNELDTFTQKVGQDLSDKKYKVAIDNRSQSYGAKLSLADFLSVPLRISVSDKDIKNGTISFKENTGRITENLTTETVVLTVTDTLNIRTGLLNQYRVNSIDKEYIDSMGPLKYSVLGLKKEDFHL
jgi:prolyl-tRNA synthetase